VFLKLRDCRRIKLEFGGRGLSRAEFLIPMDTKPVEEKLLILIEKVCFLSKILRLTFLYDLH